jgi:mono/diheme cytochrome c family protein
VKMLLRHRRWASAFRGWERKVPWSFAGLLVVAALCLAHAAPGAGQSTLAPKSGKAPAGNAAEGKKVFMRDGCYECHGDLGQGAASTGAPRIGPPPVPLEVFIRYVRKPANQMPPYTAKSISDLDLTNIYAYLKSIPQPPRGKDIPLLNE